MGMLNTLQDCAAILSNGRRVVESVVALTAGTGFVWLGARWHAAPRRSVRPPISAHPGKKLFSDVVKLTSMT